MQESRQRLRGRLEAADYPEDESSPLVRLFANGQRVAESAVRNTLTPEIFRACRDIGLVGLEGGTATTPFRLAFHHGLLLVLDPPELKNRRSAISGDRDLEIRNSRHLFLRQSLLVDKLRDWVDHHHGWPSWVTALARSLLAAAHDDDGA